MSMTKKSFEAMFKQNILPDLKKDYPNDKPAWRMVWNDTVDSFQKDGEITEHQASTWCHPNFLK